MLANTPAMLECHYGVPMCGAVLNTLNTRLDAAALGFMLDHAEAKVAHRRPRILLCHRRGAGDRQGQAAGYRLRRPRISLAPASASAASNTKSSSPRATRPTTASAPVDEWDAISLNYTSGTTGDPKGVVYHHRGAHLLAVGNVVTADMGRHPVYLWTLPMFHCNGWCFPWSISVKAGVHVCLRQVRAKLMYDLIAEEKVTHLCGAPIVMSILLNASAEEKRPLPHVVRFFTAAAPPPAAVLAAMKEAGFEVTHLYGLTETYGPSVVNDWKDEWNALEPQAQAAVKARQGVRYHALEGLEVIDPETMRPVPADGETMGEVMMQGNVVMKGYLKNKRATDAAFRGGWFHSGDLGVKHPDGYIQLRDRSKDIIISGGENISSIEVEDALFKHPAVQLAAVVAWPDPKWGETPCAFVELKPGASADEAELIAWCRGLLAHYKAPRRVVFAEIPKTSTGKVQKFALREKARALAKEGA